MKLNPSEKRLAIIAGSVIAAVMVYLFVVSPLIDRLSVASSGIDEAQRTLDLNTLTLDNEQRERKIVEPLSIKLARDASAAESQLLTRVGDAVRNTGLQVQSLKPERSELEQGYMRTTVRVSAVGRLEQAGRFLHALQYVDYPVRVSDLQITARKEGNDDLLMQVAVSTIFDANQKSAPARTEKAQ